MLCFYHPYSTSIACTFLSHRDTLQGRLGPGRLHHCMRLIGAAERGMDLMVERALNRTAFGKRIAQHGSFLSDLAKVRSLFFIVCMACF